MRPDPLVLLPGMMCDARLFGPQIEALSREAPVMVMPMTGGDSIARLARNVLEAAPPRFALAGLSMGGIVAMEVLAQSRDRVTRLCLMDTNAQAELASVAAAREPQIVKARTGKLAEVMRDEMKPRYLAPGPRRQAVLDTVMQMALDLGPEVFVAQSRALQRRPDQQATLRRARIPTLVICGEHDQLCPLRRHEFIAQLMPLAHLEVIPDAGHLPTLERPRLVTALLRRWLWAPAGAVLA
ncbi:MAG: alpha/beta fold hydrolase [Alphaproteobacteria bacterium]|nr:MAG: alpha/beta fold hydrolase [Alphaproteobacteria bacterium]